MEQRIPQNPLSFPPLRASKQMHSSMDFVSDPDFPSPMLRGPPPMNYPYPDYQSQPVIVHPPHYPPYYVPQGPPGYSPAPPGYMVSHHAMFCHPPSPHQMRDMGPHDRMEHSSRRTPESSYVPSSANDSGISGSSTPMVIPPKRSRQRRPPKPNLKDEERENIRREKNRLCAERSRKRKLEERDDLRGRLSASTSIVEKLHRGLVESLETLKIKQLCREDSEEVAMVKKNLALIAELEELVRIETTAAQMPGPSSCL